MEKTFYYNQRYKILKLLIWCMLIGLVGFVSLEETKPYHEALLEYDVPEYGVNNMEMGNYFERKAYEQVTSRYHLRVIRSVMIAGLGFIGLYYILKPRKIVLSENEIQVYSYFKKKPYIHKQWNEITSINIGAATGIHGIIGSQGLQLNTRNKYDSIESEYVASSHYQAGSEINQVIHNLDLEQLEIIDQPYKVKFISLKEMFTVGIRNLKKNYKIYYLFSGISCLFTALQQYFKSSPASLIAMWGALFFGYRALGALCHHALCDIRGEKSDFDSSWTYSKTQWGRIIGATILQSIVIIIFVIVEFLTLMSELLLWQKLVVLIPLGLMAFYLYARLFLLPYIAAIIDKKESYMAINTYVCQNSMKQVMALASIWLLYFIALHALIYPYMDNLNALSIVVQKFAYLNVVFYFLVEPIYVSCAMILLKNLSFKSASEVEGGLIVEETI